MRSSTICLLATLFEVQPMSNAEWGLTSLRIVVGIVFPVHGGQKIFVYGFAGVQGAFARMGIPAPIIIAPFIALLELVGGFFMPAGYEYALTLFAAGVALAGPGAAALEQFIGKRSASSG
jgi:putative oxidoreductase